MNSPDLITAAEAYRVERARYWVSRVKIGESVTPGGTIETLATQVLNHDKTSVLFSGTEPEAKAWLDQTCLKAALRQLAAVPSDDLVAAAGGIAVLQRVVSTVVPQV